MTTSPAYAVRRLKTEGRRSVWLTRRPDGELRTVKVWPVRLEMVLKLLTGGAQPQRQRRAAEQLLRAGIRTPRPLGLSLAWRSGPAVELELEFVPGRSALTMLNEMRREPIEPARRRHLAESIGAIVRNLAAGGLFNRDLKLENVIIDEQDPPEVWVIDPVGVRALREPTAEIARMLERLAVQPVELGLPIPMPVILAVARRALAGLSSSERQRVFAQLRHFGGGPSSSGTRHRRTHKAAGGT